MQRIGKRTVLVYCGSIRSVIHLRSALVESLVERGNQVFVCAYNPQSQDKAIIEKFGAQVRTVRINRVSISAISFIGDFFAYLKVLREIKPDTVFAFHLKSALIAGISAATFLKSYRLVLLLEGLGRVLSPSSYKHRLTRLVVWPPFKIALSKANKVLFVNEQSRAQICLETQLPISRTAVLPGAGVDLARFKPHYFEKGQRISLLMISRLLWLKGVREYAEACRALKSEGFDFDAYLVGPIAETRGEGPDKPWLDALAAKSGIQYLGVQRDVQKPLSQASIFILPTYYPEGLPQVILEAMACGKPVVATDTPGCQDAVRQAETGFLVEPRSAEALQAAIRQYMQHTELIRSHGVAGRLMAEQKFNSIAVSEAYAALIAPKSEETDKLKLQQ